MKNITTTIAIIFLLFTGNSFSQKINAPQLSFEYACLNEAFNTFEATFTFNEKPFAADNKFYIELSNSDGQFDSPTILKTVEGENYSFEFKQSFSLPQDVYGENYKIRLRATSPAITGESTQAFDAFFVPNEEIVLNNYNDVSLCSQAGTKISLDNDIAKEYVWYKNGDILKVTSENYINVTEPGEYYAEPYYGNCTGSIYSNLVIVNKGEAFEVSILGNKSIEPCSDAAIVLQASVDNENYIYTWFKNEEKISELDTYAPKIELENKEDNFGSYRVEVTNSGGCTSSSEEVSIVQNKSTIVEVTSPLNAVIIGENTATLSIETNNKGANINWYRDGLLLKEGYNNTRLIVSEAGEYYAEVSSSAACEGNIKSPSFKIYEPVSFSATIKPTSNYDACVSMNTELTIASLTGKLKNGDVLSIDKEFFHNFKMKWFKDGISLKNTSASLPLDYTDNGVYELAVTYKNIDFISNKQEIVLGLPEVALEIVTPMSCTNLEGELKATVLVGAKYDWYNGDKLVASGVENTFVTTSTGDFKVEVSLGGCAITSRPVSLNQDSEGLIDIYPGEKITISPDRIIEANATGGESYEWLDEAGNILSKTATFSIAEEGNYTLFAKIGGCIVEKSVEVVSNDVVEIPNLISPNDDSVNDKWTLPQKFINDPEIEVVICDSYGSTVLKTTKYDNSWPNSSMKMNAEIPVFYYFVNKKGKNIKKGSITLVN